MGPLNDPIVAEVSYWANTGYPQHLRRITSLHFCIRAVGYPFVLVAVILAFIMQPWSAAALAGSVLIMGIGLESAFLQCHLGCTIMGASVITATACINHQPRKVAEAREHLLNGIKAMRCRITPSIGPGQALVPNPIHGVQGDH